MSFFVFKHKTAYELRIIDWSSDVCSSDLGDEGGFAPNVPNHEAAIQLILKAIAEAGYEPGSQIALGLDGASSEFYRDGQYTLAGEGGLSLSSQEFATLTAPWCDKSPIISIEAGMAENDWDGGNVRSDPLGQQVQPVGPDTLVPN